MSFPTPDAGTGLYAAIVSGAALLISRWLSRKERTQGPAEQQKQINALRTELRKLYGDTIADLRREAKEDKAEILRLNRLLNQERSGGNDQ